MELFQRVKQICQELAGSETKLAAQLGMDQRKLNGYLNQKSQKNLWEHLPKILELYPQVSRYWLYLDEGEMLDSGLGKDCSAQNSRGALVGDLLADALEFAGIAPENARQAAKIHPQEWQGILASARYPTFIQMQALYLQFGLNPQYLFTHKYFPFTPLSRLEMIQMLLGEESAYPPTTRQMEAWFSCSSGEAREYRSKYKNWQERVREKGYKNLYDEAVKDDGCLGLPALPDDWIRYFCGHIHIKWLPKTLDFSGGLVVFQETAPPAERQIPKTSISYVKDAGGQK